MDAKTPKRVNFINVGKWILCGCTRHRCPLASPHVHPLWHRPSCAGRSPNLGQDLLGQCSCPVVGGVALLILGHGMVHQPQSLGLCPAQSSACEDELLRQGHPQASRQPLSPSCQDGVGVVNLHGKWEAREGPGWESAKTSQKSRLS